MRRLDRVAGRLLAKRRVVLLVGLLLTVVLGSGMAAIELETSYDEFVGGTADSRADDYVEANFRGGPENATTAFVIVRREYHVVGLRDIEEQLRFQQRIREDPRVAPTLAAEQPLGIANVIAMVTIQAESGSGSGGGVDPLPEPRPSLADQLAIIRDPSIRESSGGTAAIEQYEDLAIKRLNNDPAGPPGGVYAFVPRYYDNRYERRAHGTVIYVYQKEGLTDQQLLESQTAMREIADEVFRETPATDQRVYGQGIVTDELDRSTTDSLRLVGPLALLLVLGVLLYTYRDPLDVLLALGGVGVVLIWTFGFMGWLGIEFNQLFVSIPVFLMGLAIDYGIHAVMRYREERERDPLDPRVIFLGQDGDPGISAAMVAAIGGVGGAFVLVTLSTAVGFGSNVTSPVQAITEFGLVAAFGIVSALVVFGALLPAAKIELDQRLAARGYDRRARAFGARRGRLGGLLDRSVHLAERAPIVIVAVALVATTAGLAGAATVDTTFDQSEFHVEATPEWMQSLPAAIRPGSYNTHGSLEFFRESGFVNDRNLVHLLVRGDVTAPDTLKRVATARTAAADSNATLTFGRHDLRLGDRSSTPIPNTRGPVQVMRDVAAENESFNQTFVAADTDGDGIPDRDLRGVYDHLYTTDPKSAETVVHRVDGEYRALRVGVYTDGTQSNQFVADEMHAVAALVDGDGLTAEATGQPMIRAAVQEQLFATILRGFALTLALVLAMLVLVYWWTRGSPSLGVVTMLPVLCALTWILGTMAVLGLGFNILTALITSFTIGLGVDYSIHISERYVQELRTQRSVTEALEASVFGTGGALLGSALTTAGGFGVLVFAILDPLQQFGAITAMTIAYAFVASVVVLPALLVLWTRWADAAPELEPTVDADQPTISPAGGGGE